MDISIMKFTIISKLFNPVPKFPKKHQAYVFQTISELHQQGFSINQSLQFMCLLLPKYKGFFEQINQSLMSGLSIDQAFACLNITQEIKAQLFFGQKQGDLDYNLIRISQYLKHIQKYRTEIIKVLIYPIILFFCLISMLFGIRTYILPQILDFVSYEYYQKNVLIQMLVQFFVYLPQLTLLISGLSVAIIFGFQTYLNRLDPLSQFQTMVRWPLIKKWVKLYSSYRLSKEMGCLYRAGFSMQQILNLWLDHPIDPFLTMVAEMLNQGFLQGKPLSEQIQSLKIFQAELPMVIQHGELTSHVAEQCHQYSMRLYEDLLSDIQRKIAYIQPILFIIIAFFILVLYLLMMLPMLTMEGIQ